MIKKDLIQWISLFIAIIGVIAYRQIESKWYMIMWLPIIIGYGLWFDNKK